MKETYTFTVDPHDIDAFGNVRVSSIQRYMQTVADRQLMHTHPTRKELAEKKQAFIVSKMQLKMHAPLHIYDEITSQSWLYECKGVQFNRMYKIFRGKELVAEGNSVWALIGEVNKILRATEWDCSVHTDEDIVSIPSPYRIPRPEVTEYRQVGKRQVYYGDIDVNGHMNNTVYPDMYCAFIPELHYSKAMGQKYIVSDMTINYVSEAPLDEVLSVFIAKDNEKYYFKTVRTDGKVNTEAQIKLKKIN